MKALSFLGTSCYRRVTYVWTDQTGEQSYQTELFPEAVARIFQPEQLVVFVTPQVRAHRNFEQLRSRLQDLMVAVDIPEGRSEAEFWEIFDRVAGAVNDGESVLLDVTHAFRSIPLLVATVAAYLRRTKNVNVARIVYGAYDARQPLRNPPDPEDRAPIFDLTPTLDLLDWLSGAEALLSRGDAYTLAQQIQHTHQRLWQQRTSPDLPTRLQSIGRKLEGLSNALQLARPEEVMSAAHQLVPMLDAARKEFVQWAKPFVVIVEKVRDELARFAYDRPRDLNAENLRRQLELIRYYTERGLILQAVALAREWLVSWVLLQRGQGDWLRSEDREEAERALGAAAQRLRGAQGEVPPWLEAVPAFSDVVRTWSDLANLRNDLAHCGMRQQPSSAESIVRQARDIPGRLQALLDDAPATTLPGARVVIDVRTLYDDVARLDDLPTYIEKAVAQAGEGLEVILTGQGPIWLYLAVAHALHGKARRLLYTSPASGEVLIFDHTPR